MLVQKLRIYAMLMRLQELEQERIEEIKKRLIKPFLPEPFLITNTAHLHLETKVIDNKFLYNNKSKYHR